MNNHLPLSGKFPTVTRGFDNGNLTVLAWIMVDRYRFDVADMKVTCDTQRARELRIPLLSEFRSGVGKKAFLLVDSLRDRGLTIHSVTFALPEDRRSTVRVERDGSFHISKYSDREEMWTIVTQCLKGRGSGHRLSMHSVPGARFGFTDEEMSMIAG